MRIRKQWHTGIFYPLILLIIVGVLCWKNYTPGTILSGWDTLHPEFNLPLAFSRTLSGVWRTDQGLGAVAAHSHMADLPHVVILWMLSLIEPIKLIRYSFLFLCLFGGILGMYYFLRHILKAQKLHSFIACTGAIVYLTSLGTAQQFIVPFEMFTVEYALLPWILLTAIRYLETPSRKHMLGFITTILLASPMAYAATLWYVFFGLFVIFILYVSWSKRRKSGLRLIVTTLILNLYWLLPNVYFVIFHGKDVELSKVNRLFSLEAFAKNQEFGNLANLPLVKNFLFDWQLYSYKSSAFTDVMAAWKSHMNNSIVEFIGFAIFFIALIGIVQVSRHKNKVGQAFAILFMISGFILLNGTWPMNTVFYALGAISGIAREALRFPFTKFSIFYMVSMSVLTCYGLELFVSFVRRNIAAIGLTVIFASLLYFFLPAFGGNLIQPAICISIPQEYFDMFAWFKTQPVDGRVALLPIHSFWNWTYYTWGYQGSGFLQFGIPQPILDRDYDRWSPDNEQYEREMSYAIYSQDPVTIRTVLTKFNVTWVLVDNSVFAPATNENQTLVWLMPYLLQRAGLSRIKQFGSSITVYRVPEVRQTVSGFTDLPSVGPILTGGQTDSAYQQIGTYKSGTVNAENDLTRTLINHEERITTPLSGTIIKDFTPSTLPTASGINCTTRTQTNQPIRTSDSVQYTSTNTPICDHIDIPELDHANNYVVEITSKHESGFPLELCISNNLTFHCDVYEYLGTQHAFVTERFFLPELLDYGFGYSLNLNNYAIRGITSVNDIQMIRILSVEPSYTIINQPAGLSSSQTVTALSPAVYRVHILTPSTTVALWQTYESGWMIVQKTKTFPFMKRVGTHVLLNNWANGWTGNFGTSDIIYIIFLPQLLEWIGFALLPAGVMFALKHI